MVDISKSLNCSDYLYFAHAHVSFHNDPYRSYVHVCTRFYVYLSIPVYLCTSIFPDIFVHVMCINMEVPHTVHTVMSEEPLWISCVSYEKHCQLLLISFSDEEIM